MTEREFGPIERPPYAVWPPYEFVPGVNGPAVFEAALRESLRGIELGAYDEQIVDWLSNWDAPTVAVLVSWLERVRRAGVS